MKGYDSKSKFNEITGNSHYLRVDETHPLELLIGLNDKGQKMLRFTGEFVKVKVKGTKIIDVGHFTSRDGLMMGFTLLDQDYFDLFCLFCNDLVDSSRSIKQEDGYVFLVNRYDKWRNFIGQTRKFMSEIEIRGLIGELLFLLETAIPKYGVSRALQGWSGPEPTKKDFSYDDLWYEIKTTSNGRITISSIDQLDSDGLGRLVVYALEKMSPEFHGITINSLADAILSLIRIDQDRTDFILGLVKTGFFREPYYDDFVYSRISCDEFLVDIEFPRIRRTELHHAIDAVKYEIVLTMIEERKVIRNDA